MAPESAEVLPTEVQQQEVKDAFAATMGTMHGPVMEGMTNADPDAAYVLGMVPHHQGAVDMSNVVLQYGNDPEVLAMARSIIAHQQSEMATMNAWLEKQGLAAAPE